MDWQFWVEKAGVPLVLLAVIGYYVRKDLVLPLRDRLISQAVDFLNELRTALRRMESHQMVSTPALSRMMTACDRIEDELYEVSKGLETMVDSCGRMESHLIGQPYTPPRRRQRPQRPRPPDVSGPPPPPSPS